MVKEFQYKKRKCQNEIIKNLDTCIRESQIGCEGCIYYRYEL